jgi:hypothetical protein
MMIVNLENWLALAPKPRPLANGDEWNVFLSYRSINRSWVLNLYDVLKQAGHKVFLDQYELKANDKLIIRLSNALAQSQAGILVWSTAAADSDWVQREYMSMLGLSTRKKGFAFIPLKLDKHELPMFAAEYVYLDFAAYPDGPNGGELLRLLHSVVNQPLSDQAVIFANELDEASLDTLYKIQAAIRHGKVNKLVELAHSQSLPWLVSSALGCKAAEGLTKLKANEEAIHVLGEVMQRFPKAIRPKQLYALALANRGQEGDLDTAQEILGELYSKGERDPETLGIYARTWMDRYKLSGNKAELLQSRDLYAEAFEKAPDDYYTGVNAAAKSVFLGGKQDLERAAHYASQVQQVVGSSPCPNDYWKTATVAEVLLIQQQYDQAAKLYQAAIATARMETGSHASTLKQAKLLLEKLASSESEKALVLNAFSEDVQ